MAAWFAGWQPAVAQNQPLAPEDYETWTSTFMSQPAEPSWLCGENGPLWASVEAYLCPWADQGSSQEGLAFRPPSLSNQGGDPLPFHGPTGNRTEEPEAVPAGESSRREPWRVPLVGSVFLFGQAKRGDAFSAAPDAKVTGGQTGVEWGLPIQKELELQVRCGTQLAARELAHASQSTDRLALPFSTQLLRLEVEGRWTVVGQMAVEWQGAASPALSPLERDLVQHELRLVFPLGQAGQLQLGTRRSWEYRGDSRPWDEGSQIYGGFRARW
jgi:hypothetical protein